MKITAAVLRDKDAPYTIEDVELADPGPGELRVRIAAAGFCHTDLLPRVSEFTAPPPLITGHEGAGVVETVGDGVTGVAEGDHVVLSYDSCRACTNCVSGHTAYCDTFFARNLVGLALDGSTPVRDANGGAIAARWFGQSSFATHSVVAARNVVPVDPSLPLDVLAPLGCGVLTGAGSVLVALGVRPGTSIVVFGAGGVGLSAIMAARVAGASRIVAVDLNPARLALAGELGATHTFDGASDGLLENLLDTTGGGAQYALDTTGVPAVIQTAVAALRPTGTAGLVGVQQGDVTFDPMALALGRNVMGILEGDAVPQLIVPRLVELWQQGRFPVERLVQTFPLDRINEAEQATVKGEVVKPVLLPARPTRGVPE